METYNFEGWATKANLKCSDGRVIMPNAFAHNSGEKVPLVWCHKHGSPENVLGHALLENREDGVWAKCSFNDTENGQLSKVLVEHGDITSLSIYANQLKQNGPNVMHGMIREVSLVHAGANPGARIQSVITHSFDGSTVELEEDEGVIHTGLKFQLYSEDSESSENTVETTETTETTEETTDVVSHEDSEEKSEKTIGDILKTLNEEQETAVYALIGQIAESLGHSATADEDEAENETDTENTIEHSEGGNETMKKNVFDAETQQDVNVLSHEDQAAIIADAKRYGSMKESALAHGIEDIEWLFPEAKNVTNTPIWIDREQGWVKKVMSAIHHVPYSRIKSMFADITADEARALGYLKGNYKKEEVFTLLKRTTAPTTVYKKQKLDRDDVIDITDFDVIGWIKAEMRGKLEEELARAFLIGDGRLADSDDKIKEDCIRPVWTDDDKLFTINKVVEHDGTEEDRAAQFIRAAIKARKGYRGSGSPTLYCSEDLLTEMLLLTDGIGHDLYDEAKLCKKLRVKEIVTVPVMEGAQREKDGQKRGLLGIIVNMNDYNVGADKGGAINMFDDFDIDYNAQKYLMETRCSGALVQPFAAITLEEVLA